ncbi:MAG: DUF456 domain-containing protein [Syntrophales bacterium]|jgi:uncharacterized protein YqgC (DUF456 family)|nr:DUF456 domain-containing protein [Syntrophales bacterium]MDY0043409.1 DUF456 domain-containing protein [Syntrophales bacterium]
MAVFLIIIGFMVALAGIVGCLLPTVPGPIIAYISLIIISIAKNWAPFSEEFLVIMGILTLIVSFADNVLPLGGARKYGASKLGVAGATLGMLVGIFVIPPFGVFLGAFAGAVAGELFSRKKGQEALRAGWGVFVGVVLAIGFKLAFTLAVLGFYIRAIFK